MNINRHNYEEYFILYMDNELSDADRRMVEDFAQHNPDLKEELDILLQSKLIPDHSIVFEDKTELIKTESDLIINSSNYEEWLTLYIDDELSVSEKIEVEKFAAENTAVKKDLELLLATKLTPEKEIVFPNKESLYRREEKVRVIPIRWWRAVAAVLILAFGLTSFFILNKRQPKKSGETVAINKTTPAKIDNSVKKDDKKEITNQPEVALNNNSKKTDQEETTSKRNKEQRIQDNTKFIADVSTTSNDVASLELKKYTSPIPQNPQSNNLPSSINNPNVNISSTLDPVLATINSDNKKLTNPQIGKSSVTDQNSQTSIQGTEPEFASESDNKKTRGLFRKVVRLFSKTTKIDPTDGDDRVMIASVNVKLR